MFIFVSTDSDREWERDIHYLTNFQIDFYSTKSVLTSNLGALQKV
jgi:hypothetical protein